MHRPSEGTTADQLREAATLLKAGNKAAAKSIVVKVLGENQNNAEGWFLAAYIHEDKSKKIQALQRALSLDPGNQKYQTALDKLQTTEVALTPAPRHEPAPRGEPVQRQPAQGRGNLVIGLAGVLLGALIAGPIAWGVAQQAAASQFSLTSVAAMTTADEAARGTVQVVESTRIALVANIAASETAISWTATPTITPTPTSIPTITITPTTEAQPITLAATSPTSGKWAVTEDKSVFDDSVTIVFRLEADIPVQGWLRAATPTLLIRCEEKILDVYVHTGGQLEVSFDSDLVAARVRYDKEPAQTIYMGESTSGEALFFREPVQALNKLLLHEQMAFGYTPYNAGSAETVFDLRGLASIVQPLKDACNIKS